MTVARDSPTMSRVPAIDRFLRSPAARDPAIRTHDASGEQRMKILPSLAAVLPLVLACPPSFAQTDSGGQHTYQLKPTPTTVTWGYYSASAPPVLRIHSGDTVQIQTLLTSSPKRLAEAGVPANRIEQSLRDIFDQVKDRGPGGHILTGPVYVEGAQPGDVLEVRIKAIQLAIPYAYNAFSTRSGFIPQDFKEGKMKIIPLDKKRMVAHFSDTIEIPLHPFFGSIGVAPPPAAGRVSSAPPGR